MIVYLIKLNQFLFNVFEFHHYRLLHIHSNGVGDDVSSGICEIVFLLRLCMTSDS